MEIFVITVEIASDCCSSSFVDPTELQSTAEVLLRLGLPESSLTADSPITGQRLSFESPAAGERPRKRKKTDTQVK